MILHIKHLDRLEDIVTPQEFLVQQQVSSRAGTSAFFRDLDLLPGSDQDWSCLGLDASVVLRSRSRLAVSDRSGFPFTVKMFAIAVAGMNFASHQLYMFFFNPKDVADERHPSSLGDC